VTRGALAALLAGLVLAVAVALWCGLDAVAGALARAGWLGLFAVSAYHLVPKALCGAAWWLVLPRGSGGLARFFGFRWLRDGANDLLGVVPAAGELAAVRAMALRGIPVRLGAASTIVDLTVEMAAQCAFIALVLVLLGAARPDQRIIVPAAIGLALLAALLGGLVVVQHRRGAVRLLDRVTTWLARGLGLALALQLDRLHATIAALYAARRRVAGAFALHLLAWIVGIGEGWIGLALMGVPVGALDIVMLETGAFILRSAGFMLPGALGIQEGGYALLAPLIGIPADAALALSLLKRGRELMLGAPACMVWQLGEGRRLWRGRRAQSAG
jgi:putative membrane protein